MTIYLAVLLLFAGLSLEILAMIKSYSDRNYGAAFLFRVAERSKFMAIGTYIVTLSSALAGTPVALAINASLALFWYWRYTKELQRARSYGASNLSTTIQAIAQKVRKS